MNYYEKPVLLKEPALEPPTPSHLNQFHNEYDITRQLAENGRNRCEACTTMKADAAWAPL